MRLVDSKTLIFEKLHRPAEITFLFFSVIKSTLSYNIDNRITHGGVTVSTRK